jgi:hypothetical protein
MAIASRKGYFKQYHRKNYVCRRGEFFNGKRCIDCGATENLELDHVDPATKISNSVWEWRKERREAELAKCVARCKVCHKKRSDEQHRRPIPHGTESGYRRGCRCRTCTVVHSAARAEYRERTGRR